VPVPLVQNGINALSVIAVDQFGVETDSVTTDASGDALEVEHDSVAPSVTVDVLLTNDPTPALSGQVDDPAATMRATVGGSDYPAINNGDGTWSLLDGTVQLLADDTYDVRATATDAVGNEGEDKTSDELTIDTVAPAVTVDVLTTNDSTPALSGSVDDPSAAVEVMVNGKAYTAINGGAGSWGLSDGSIEAGGALADGTYDLIARATDAAGNLGTDPTTDELIVDTVAPAVTVDAVTTSDRTPALSGTVDDPAAAVNVRVDGIHYSAINSGSGMWSLPDGSIGDGNALGDGAYDVQASATDAAGNIGTDPTTNELVVDATGPAVTVDPLITNDTTPPLGGEEETRGWMRLVAN
jgi:hypothetical protein